MRFTALAVFLAGAGLATVNASPLRVTIVSTGISPAFVDPNNGNQPLNGTVSTWAGSSHGHRLCGHSKNKLIAFSNALRKLLGLPLIKAHSSSIKEASPDIIPLPVTAAEGHHRHHHHQNDEHHSHIQDNEHHPKHKHHHKHHRHSFGRLWKAFINLGGWEGAAVAFVVGSGIGVVLRMVWVMVIVLYRNIRGSAHRGYTEIPTGDHAVIHIVAPPEYVEKVPIEEDIKEEQKVNESA